jgi:hypothetical protein
LKRLGPLRGTPSAAASKEKKLSGVTKSSFEKKCIKDAVG